MPPRKTHSVHLLDLRPGVRVRWTPSTRPRRDLRPRLRNRCRGRRDFHGTTVRLRGLLR